MQTQAMRDETSKNPPFLGTEKSGEAATNKKVDPGEIARQFGALSAFFHSKTGSNDLTGEIDEAAVSARTAIEVEEAVEEETAQAEEKIPIWGKLPSVEKVFVEPMESEDMWEPVAEPVGKTNDLMEVKYRYADDVLTPGVGKNEQAIQLKKINNTFTLDEWNLIVKPILDRYVKSLQLRKVSKIIAKDKNKYEKRVKNLLPQIFRSGEFGKIEEVDVARKEFNTQINELLNEVNTNPDVLKGWIKEILAEEKPAQVARKTDKSGLRKYEQLHADQEKKRILKRFQKSEDSLEAYIEDLSDRISNIGEQLLYLNYHRKEGLYGTPEVKADFEETPYMQKKLAELTEKAGKQLERKKGMVSMIGDMGTGKNYIVEHFSAKTNRPFFYFPCSRGMDAADLGFHFWFRKGESFVVPSNLAKGLKTKNACILIDEPNSLPPEVVSALHGLADHNRSFVYNGVEFKAAEGVVVMMTMNPATYAHVKSLPEAISDRTLGQDIVIDYPPLTKLDSLTQDNLWSKQQAQEALQADNSLDKIFICDEALILRKYIPQLKEWSPEDFAKLWDVVINSEAEGILGDKADKAQALKPFVTAIFNILKVCHRWREKYKAGDMARTISLRGSIAVIENYLHTKDVKKAFLDLYKPNSRKYDGGEEDYENLEQVMNDMKELEISVNETV